MTTPIVNAVVTAYPTTLGFPTLSGQTNDSGEAVLPLSNHTSYNFQFTQGAMGAVLNVFPPANHTFTLYRLKNVTASTVPISVYPIFKLFNTEVGIGRGTSQFALPGSYPVSIPAGRGANFKSYRPGSLFANPLDRSTVLRMPARDVSFSIVSQAPPPPTVHRINAIGGGITSTTGRTTQYNSSGGIWSYKLADPTPRQDLAGRGVNKVVYAIDGEAAGAAETAVNHGYSVPANTWATLASDLNIRRAASASVVGNNIYVVDGLTVIAGVSHRIAYNHKYDTSINSWTAKTSDLVDRSNPVAGAIGSVVYVTGGFTGVLTSATTAYHIATNTWSSRAKDLVGRANAAGAVLSSRLFVVGGRSTGNSYLARNDKYDPVSNTWTAVALAPTGKQALAAAPMNGKMFIVDGKTRSTSGGAILTSGVHVFDPKTSGWSKRANDLSARAYLMAGVASK